MKNLWKRLKAWLLAFVADELETLVAKAEYVTSRIEAFAEAKEAEADALSKEIAHLATRANGSRDEAAKAAATAAALREATK